MKHMLLFAAIALIGLVSSCKKEATSEELLIGKWQASQAFIGTNNALVTTSTSRTELQIEFKEGNALAFTWQTYNLTTNPPVLIESTLNGTYSWNGDNISITVVSGSDTRTVTGTMDVSGTNFLFTGTSGDIDNFISLLEADRI